MNTDYSRHGHRSPSNTTSGTVLGALEGPRLCAEPEQILPDEDYASTSSHSCPPHNDLPATQTTYQGSSKPIPSITMLLRSLKNPLGLNLVLENTGSVARDHLASERTYLAYVRTSLACASAGVALVQLFTLSKPTNVNSTTGQHSMNLQKYAQPLGATVVLLGLLILLHGLFRYFITQGALTRGIFPAARISIAAITFALGSIVGIVFGILIAGR
ncbi:hypothetical protein SERLADRAFT_392038 [Serpula lacrymans var. lacrymans S7.9]|nr:uncharacterized protein SERLADRAFT_392038 [Serpula lacrymans var. lacrymans S7.9]EGO23713.1 hypothetical protein SERLADRAFT_392038 [Serpula lacrymans var. lacrymans S7.9]